MKDILIGAHTSTKNGIIEGINYIQEIGGNTAQIFLGSNKSSSLKMKTKLTDDECTRIKRYCEINKFHLFIHAVYVLNFSSFPAFSARIKYAHDNVIYDIEYGYKMGIKGVVIHLGFQKDLDELEAYENMASNIIHVVKKTRKTPVKILLETPAGSGTQIGSDIPRFIKVFSLIKNKLDTKEFNSRIGVCLDTAHIFSSGHNIQTLPQIKSYLNTYYTQMNTVLKEPISLIHLNDSKVGLNSRRDIHAGLGQGEIYNKSYSSKALQFLLKYIFKKSAQIPFILETHGAGSHDSEKDGGQYRQEINLVKQLVNLPSSKTLKINIKPNFLKKNLTKKNSVRAKSNNYLLYKENKDIVTILTIIRNYYDVTKNPIKVNAYKKALYQIRKYPYKITSGEEIEHLDGIGQKMIDKINIIVKTGTLPIIREKKMSETIEKSKTKPEHTFGNILGFGPTIIKKLAQLNISSLDKLKDEIQSPNSRIKLTKLQTIGLKYHKQLSELISRDESEYVFGKLDKLIGKLGSNKGKLLVYLAGSFLSGKIASKDIDILMVKKESNEKSMKEIGIELGNVMLPDSKIKLLENISSGERNMMALIEYKYDGKTMVRHLDIKLTTESELSFAYLHFTGGEEYNKYVRDKAKGLGYKLNEKGLFKKGIQVSKDEIGLEDINIESESKKVVLKKVEKNMKKIVNFLGVN